MAEIVWNVPVIFSKEKKFPIYPWLPYDPTSTNLIYYAMLVYTTSVMLYDGFVATMTDPLIGGLAYHATAQIKILKYNLENIDKHVHKITMENEYSTIAYKMAYKHLKQCVNRHNHILKGSTLVRSVAIASISSLTYFLCFLVISGQILFYCHYGTLLYEENKSLAESIYMGCWFQCDVKIRKVLIMMMERSKRSMVFTAGAVINVTFQTFLSVLKTSYSLVAVLNSFDKPVGE
ncbi:odorant receptor Or1-like [Zophobas morio]|uniref:odorant receptor Or1-like n=1 Tax=Zophobas morio TaxID=2755281 RepID=UPI003083429B